MLFIEQITNGRRVITPESKEGMPLFSHCSNGSIAVTPKYFKEVVQDLLINHGVIHIKIIDMT